MTLWKWPEWLSSKLWVETKDSWLSEFQKELTLQTWDMYLSKVDWFVENKDSKKAKNMLQWWFDMIFRWTEQWKQLQMIDNNKEDYYFKSLQKVYSSDIALDTTKEIVADTNYGYYSNLCEIIEVFIKNQLKNVENFEWFIKDVLNKIKQISWEQVDESNFEWMQKKYIKESKQQFWDSKTSLINSIQEQQKYMKTLKVQLQSCLVVLWKWNWK